MKERPELTLTRRDRSNRRELLSGEGSFIDFIEELVAELLEHLHEFWSGLV